jgi:hypothetical protein
MANTEETVQPKHLSDRLKTRVGCDGKTGSQRLPRPHDARLRCANRLGNYLTTPTPFVKQAVAGGQPIPESE